MVQNETHETQYSSYPETSLWGMCNHKVFFLRFTKGEKSSLILQLLPLSVSFYSDTYKGGLDHLINANDEWLFLSFYLGMNKIK